MLVGRYTCQPPFYLPPLTQVQKIGISKPGKAWPREALNIARHAAPRL